MPYRQTCRPERINTILLLLGGFLMVAGAIALAALRGPAWLISVPFGSFLILGISGHVVAKRAFRALRESIRLELEDIGFAVDIAPHIDRREVVYAPVEYLGYHLTLSTGAHGVQWLALHPENILIFEHQALLGATRKYTNRPRTVIVFQHDHPALPRTSLGTQPWAALHRPRLGERFNLRRRPHRITTGDPIIDSKWYAFGHEQTARNFLAGSDVVRELAESPVGESWVIGEGFICCAFSGRLNAGNLLTMYLRAHRILER